MLIKILKIQKLFFQTYCSYRIVGVHYINLYENILIFAS